MVGLVLFSCYKDKLPEKKTDDVIIDVPEGVSFQTDIQPIFTQNCINCHKAGSTAPDLTSGVSYAAITSGGFVVASNADGSELYNRLNGVGGALMPTSGALPADKIALVKQWINEGALNN